MAEQGLSKQVKMLAVLGTGLIVFVACTLLGALIGNVADMDAGIFRIIIAVPIAVVCALRLRSKRTQMAMLGDIGTVIGCAATMIVNILVLVFEWEAAETWIIGVCLVVAFVCIVVKLMGWIGGGIKFRIR